MIVQKMTESLENHNIKVINSDRRLSHGKSHDLSIKNSISLFLFENIFCCYCI